MSVIFALTTHDGYNGDMDLLIAINKQGTLQAVRVVRHQETPGLGDAVEPQKSDWILQFDQLPTTDWEQPDWQLAKYGGRFQQMTGATITATAVIEAVERTVKYFNNNHNVLLSTQTDRPSAP